MLFSEYCRGEDYTACSVVVPKDTWEQILHELDARGRSLRAAITWHQNNSMNAKIRAQKQVELKALNEMLDKLSLVMEEI